jgi:hypothetical protein
MLFRSYHCQFRPNRRLRFFPPILVVVDIQHRQPSCAAGLLIPCAKSFGISTSLPSKEAHIGQTKSSLHVDHVLMTRTSGYSFFSFLPFISSASANILVISVVATVNARSWSIGSARTTSPIVVPGFFTKLTIA